MLFIFIGFVMSGCAALDGHSSFLPEDEVSKIVSRARKLVLESGMAKDEKEHEFVIKNEPYLRYYFIARTYAEYLVSWQVGDSESIRVSGRGNILLLENASVIRSGNE